MWEKRSKVVFGTGVLIAVVIFFQMIMYALHVLFDWELHFNIIQICTSVIHKYGLDSVGYALDLIVFYTLLMTLWITGKQIYLSQKAYKQIQNYENTQGTIAINQQYSNKRDDFIVVNSSDPLAFTMGFWKSRIVLSTGLLELLDQEELAAVTYHELYHKEKSDPMKTLLLYLFASVMWYLPILKWFHQNYKIIREILADQYSIKRAGTPAHLGSALLKLLRVGGMTPQQFSHVSFAETSINYRIQQLLEPQAEVPLRFPVKSMMISLQILFIICASFILALS